MTTHQLGRPADVFETDLDGQVALPMAHVFGCFGGFWNDFWDENSQKVILFMTHVFFLCRMLEKIGFFLKHLAQTLAKLSKKN